MLKSTALKKGAKLIGHSQSTSMFIIDKKKKKNGLPGKLFISHFSYESPYFCMQECISSNRL